MKILGDGEILEANYKYEWTTEFDFNIIDEEKELDRWKAIAQAQLEEDREWGEEDCPHLTVMYGGFPCRKRECSECWQELEVKKDEEEI